MPRWPALHATRTELGEFCSLPQTANGSSLRLGKVSQPTGRRYEVPGRAIARIFELQAAYGTEFGPMGYGFGIDDGQETGRVGLILDPEPKPTATLEACVEGYVSRRNDVSRHTRRIWRQTLRPLSSHFGADKPFGDITRGDAADWRLSLVAAKMADASVRKHCGFAKYFFAQAVDRELIPVNPFAKLVSAPVGNAARQYSVTREETAATLEAAPDAEWRLIIALTRYGGLHCPSEHLAITWNDVDWARDRITIRSHKTARHAGHESRIVPLFPELRPYLEAVFDAADPGLYPIKRYRDPNANLRTQMERIVRRAGLKPWPRFTHNLRASRATELAADYPAHVAAAWLGHSAAGRRKALLGRDRRRL